MSIGINNVFSDNHLVILTARTQLCELWEGLSMGYFYIGDIFLKFILHEQMIYVCGVNVKLVRSTDPEIQDFEAGRPRN